LLHGIGATLRPPFPVVEDFWRMEVWAAQQRRPTSTGKADLPVSPIQKWD
jgi:hypothetical protein